MLPSLLTEESKLTHSTDSLDRCDCLIHDFSLFQTAQTVLLVVAVFLLSWLPHHIITMWAEFGHFPLNNISFTFRIISHCLAYGNSCINPILYAFLSENFRKACRQVFTCRLFLRPASAEKLARVRMENFSTTHSTTNL